MLEKISFLVQKYPKFILVAICILTIFFALPLADFKFNSTIRDHLPDYALALDDKWSELRTKIDYYYILVESPSESIFSMPVLKEQDELLKFIENFVKESGNSELEIKSFIGFLGKKIKKYSGKEIAELKDQKELNKLLLEAAAEAPREFKENFQIFLSSEISSEEFESFLEAKKVSELFPFSFLFFSNFDFKLPEANVSWIWFETTDKNKDYKDFILSLRENINALNFKYLKIHHYSNVFTEQAIDDKLGLNSIILGILIVLIVGFIIFLFLKNWLYSAVSLIIMALATVWTFGAASFLGIKFVMVHTIVFPLLLGIGVDGSIHLSKRFLEEMESPSPYLPHQEGETQGKPPSPYSSPTRGEENSKSPFLDGRGKGRVEKALRVTYSSTGFSLFLAALTTILAFVSNIVWPGSSYAFRTLGIIVIIGIFFALFLTYFFWGAVMSLFKQKIFISCHFERREESPANTGNPIKRRKELSGTSLVLCHLRLLRMTISKIPQKIFTFSMAHSRTVVSLFLILTLASLFSVPFLKTDTQTKELAPRGTQVYNDFLFLEKQKIENYTYQGILIEGDVLNPKVIFALDKFEEQIQDNKFAGRFGGKVKFESANTIFRELGVEIGEQTELAPFYDAVLQNTNIADKFLEITWKEKAESLILKDRGGNYHALLALVWIDPSKGIDKVRQAASEFEEDIGKSGFNEIPGVKTYLMGDYFVNARADAYMRENQFKSFGLAVILTFLVLVPVYFRPRKSDLVLCLRQRSDFKIRAKQALFLSAVVLVPIIIASFLTIGLMSLFRISLNFLNVAVIAITIGLGIDYALYLSGRYLEELSSSPLPLGERNKVRGYQPRNDRETAILKALNSTSSAFWAACLSTVFGFSILSFSLLPIAKSFGLLTAFAILLSVFATIVLLPILLVRFVKINKV